MRQADIDRLEARGALVLQKPLNKALFLRTVRLAMVARRRLLEIKTENAGLHHKIEEIRLIDRAKCVLIQYLGLTEPQAHRYIEKQAWTGGSPAGRLRRVFWRLTRRKWRKRARAARRGLVCAGMRKEE